MATKPTVDQRWATVPDIDPTSGQSNIIEPSSGKKDLGFARKERPPRQDHNWLFNSAYQWQQYLEDITDEHEARLDGIDTDLSQEVTDRTNADNTLQSNIDAEAASRTSDVSDLSTDISTEASTRAGADTALDTRISYIEAPVVAFIGSVTPNSGTITVITSDTNIKTFKEDETNATPMYIMVSGHITINSGAPTSIKFETGGVLDAGDIPLFGRTPAVLSLAGVNEIGIVETSVSPPGVVFSRLNGAVFPINIFGDGGTLLSASIVGYILDT